MSTVVTPALIQAHLLLASLDGAQTTLLGLIGDAVQSAIEEQTGRLFTTTSYVEGYDGQSRSFIYLRHDPIVAVTSVTRFGDGLTVGSSLAAIYPPVQCVWEADQSRLGAIRLTDGSTFWRGPGGIVVSYTAGWGTVPAGLVRAGVLWAAHLFTQGRYPSSQNGNVPALGDTPKMVMTLIDRYRRPWGAQ